MHDSQSIAESFFLYSMSQENPLKNYVANNNTSARVSMRFKDLPSDQLNKKRNTIKHMIQNQFKDCKIQESGLGMISHTINAEVSKGLVFSFWHSLLVIGLLLMFVFKSIRWALVALLRLGFPTAPLYG